MYRQKKNRRKTHSQHSFRTLSFADTQLFRREVRRPPKR